MNQKYQEQKAEGAHDKEASYGHPVEPNRPENPTLQEQDYKLLAEEYKDLLQRLQAEFDNYKKRVEKEKQELCLFAKHSLIKQLLDTYDYF